MRSRTIGGVCAVLGVTVAAAGQQVSYITGFEPPLFSGSAAGVALTNGFGGGGQDGWYNPVAGAADALVFTHSGNAYGIAPSQVPGTHLAAGRSVGPGAAVLAQRNEAFDNGDWRVTWIMTVKHDGTLPTSGPLGSFSLEPGATRSWKALFNWVDVATAAAWRCTFVVYDANGVEISPTGVLAGPAWDGLVPNRWYSLSVHWSFALNRIVSVVIRDLTTSIPVTHQPAGWYVGGGAQPALPMPAAFRYSAGGAGGNIVAWDDFQLVEECYPDCNGSGTLTIADISCYRTVFVTQNPYADCNHSGTFTIADFGCFQNAFVHGCP